MFSEEVLEEVRTAKGALSLMVHEDDLCKIVQDALHTLTAGPGGSMNWFGFPCRANGIVPKGEVWAVRGDRVVRKFKMWKGKD